MKREIKFRAWDGKKMWFNVQKAYDYIISDTKDDDPIPATTFEEISLGLDGWIPTQFTGLKDSKGKEIYEGDIVKNKDGEVYPIEYKFNSFNGRYIVEIWQLEIVGNIYESPELLVPAQN